MPMVSTLGLSTPDDAGAWSRHPDLREIRIRKEEVEQLEAEIVDNTPPSFLANLEEYDNMFNGEY